MGKRCTPLKSTTPIKSKFSSGSNTTSNGRVALASPHKEHETESEHEVESETGVKNNLNQPTKDKRELSCDDEAQFEKFAKTLSCRNLPVVVFTDDLSEQRFWRRCSVQEGCVKLCSCEPSVVVRNPVVMSPAYKSIVLHPDTKRYMHFKGVGFVFARPSRGEFMAPSIDTVLVCHALDKLFQETSRENKKFERIIDVGAGSGFIGKFAAVHAPGASRVCLVDIDPAAKEYWLQAGFGSAGVANVRWDFQVGDACNFLKLDSEYSLIISNPPYIPTRAETTEEMSVAHICGFWEGCGLLVFLLDMLEKGRFPDEAHLVVAITSLTLKSKYVCDWLSTAASKGITVRVLDERELAWKAWYAGRGEASSHLLAVAREADERQRIGSCDFFVGATKPNKSREGGEKDKIGPSADYHWHVAYVLDIFRTPNP